jgi:hypothetical protein
MAMVFWDSKGVLKVKFIKQGLPIMSEVYYKIFASRTWAILGIVWPPSLQPWSRSIYLPCYHSTSTVMTSSCGVSKCGWSHRWQARNLFLDMTSASLPVIIILRIMSLSMYVFCVYNTIFFSHCWVCQ